MFHILVILDCSGSTAVGRTVLLLFYLPSGIKKKTKTKHALFYISHFSMNCICIEPDITLNTWQEQVICYVLL